MRVRGSQFKTYLLPWHWHVFQKLVHSVRHKLEGTKVDSFVMAKLPRRHVAMVLDNLSKMLRRHIFLGCLHISVLALDPIALRI